MTSKTKVDSEEDLEDVREFLMASETKADPEEDPEIRVPDETNSTQQMSYSNKELEHLTALNRCHTLTRS